MESQRTSLDESRWRIRVRGTVQGVGFRPFVHGLAARNGLSGFVGNDNDGVFAEVEGPAELLAGFLAALSQEAPPLARVESVAARVIQARGQTGFSIVPSRRGAARDTAVAADAATCADCRRELFDPANRRFGYPFLNCTNCGPRYTIVTDVPYDRPNTTMDRFPMCPACRREYDDPADRRFHAQPVCCADCGPALSLLDAAGTVIAGPAVHPVPVRELLRRAAALLRGGSALAVKGLGGYHLAVDARSDTAVALLRARKRREERPFAVMMADLAQVEQLCAVQPSDAALLASPAAPIVVLATRAGLVHPLAPSVAPGQPDLGVMLAYTPLHHLLLEEFGGPLVLTSGNISDEPIAFEDADATRRLAGIADAFLTHDRPIRTRVDDSVVRGGPGGGSLIRRSRGYVPGPLALPWAFPRHVLACGPELKNTFCLGRGHQAVLSQHIGDLENYETLSSYAAGIAHLRGLFAVRPEVLAHDLHPDYLSTAWAVEQTGVELVGVQHHHAHIASCLAENGVPGPVIGVAFDGTGFGDDGTLWGGEFLVADLLGYTRAAHFAAVPLPGGAAAIREPWRTAASYVARAGGGTAARPLQERHADRWGSVQQMADRGLNSPLSSSVGRLFDAVAALLGLRDTNAYEGQAAIAVELAAARLGSGAARWPVRVATEPASSAVHVVHGVDLIRGVLDDLAAGVAPAVIAARFHATLAGVTVQVCERLRAEHGLATVALSGGVFQNVLLTGLCRTGLRAAGFTVLLHRRVPANDGGVSLGQAAVAGARDRAR